MATHIDSYYLPPKGLGVIDPGTAILVSSGITAGIQMLFGRRRGKQKVAATNIANDAERLLKQNLDNYFSVPKEQRTSALKQAALVNFEVAWQGLQQACNDPSLGDAGRRCISERVAGGQWDWFAAYQQPIAQDEITQGNGDRISEAISNPVRYIVPIGLSVLALVLVFKSFK